jgi:hypothetical protein
MVWYGMIHQLVGAAMGAHTTDRNTPTMAFAVASTGAANSPKHSSSRAIPTTGFGPGPTDTSSRDEVSC